jgi:hypothetical protein
MKKRLSTSFILFLIALVISAGVLLVAALFIAHNVDKKNAMYLAVVQMAILILCPLGIYIAIKTKEARFNKTGLWGNVAILAYTLGIIVYSVIM